MHLLWIMTVIINNITNVVTCIIIKKFQSVNSISLLFKPRGANIKFLLIDAKVGKIYRRETLQRNSHSIRTISRCDIALFVNGLPESSLEPNGEHKARCVFYLKQYIPA